MSISDELSTGYFNPLLAYTEQLAVEDAKKNGANGFIIVDLPPEEAVGFRSICTAEGFVDVYPIQFCNHH